MVKKDRYHALLFVNELAGGKRINLAGQGTWIKAMAREVNGVPKLLVVNYDLDNKHFETVPIRFDILPAQNFKFRRTDFMGKTREIPVATDAASWQTLELFSPNSAAIFEIIE